MKVASCDRLLKTETHFYKPFVRYVMSDFEFEQLLYKTSQTHWTFSSFNPWERRYGGQPLDDKRIAVYRHNAWGDQLIASAVPRYLKSVYPRATVHFYCHPTVLPMWKGNSFVEGSAIPIPIVFEATKKYDYVVFYEGMLEGNSEPDQNNCYDDMFSFMGIENVPREYKKPYVETRPEDYTLFNQLTLPSSYVLYHISPANRNRCWPPGRAVELLRELRAAYPRVPVIVVGKTNPAPNEVAWLEKDVAAQWAAEIPGVINLVDQVPDFRSLIPFVERAKVVICPDSAIMHLAAAVAPHVPVVSLWGVFHPHDRSKYYVNQYPLTAFDACPHAPCRNHDFFLPQHQCKDAKCPRRDACAALAAIEVHDVLGAISQSGAFRV